MPLHRFMLVVGIFHMAFGAFFFFFTSAGAYVFLEPPGAESLVIVKGLSGICFAFGLMNLMARHSPEGPALCAVLAGTLFYLLFTIGCDVHWILEGILKPVSWTSIALRLIFAGGFAYQLIRMGHPRPTNGVTSGRFPSTWEQSRTQ